MRVDPIPAHYRRRATLSVAETSEVTGLAVRTIAKLVASGEIASTRLGGRRLIYAGALWESLGLVEAGFDDDAATARRQIARRFRGRGGPRLRAAAEP